MKSINKKIRGLAVFAVLCGGLLSCTKKETSVINALDVSSSEAYKSFSKGWELMEAGEYKKSIEASKTAASLFKNFDNHENGRDFYSDCLIQIGEAYLRGGKIKKAQEQFMSALNFSPENPNISLGIAAVYFRLGKYNEGKIFFEKSIKKYSKNPVAVAPLYYYYGLCLLSQEDFEKANNAAQKSLENYIKANLQVPSEVEELLRQAKKGSVGETK